jgi:hypothetical protein
VSTTQHIQYIGTALSRTNITAFDPALQVGASVDAACTLISTAQAISDIAINTEFSGLFSFDPFNTISLRSL